VPVHNLGPYILEVWMITIYDDEKISQKKTYKKSNLNGKLRTQPYSGNNPKDSLS
jgi:hypothetical protein